MTVDNTISGGMEAESLTYHTDWTEFESPSTAIVVAVAEHEDVQEDELPVLNEYVDGDALDAVLCGSRSDVEVTFGYDSVDVEIFGDGTLVVESV